MKQMARKGTPLAYTPTGPIWPDDLDYRLGERARVIGGYALASLLIVFLLLLPLIIVGLIEGALGW